MFPGLPRFFILWFVFSIIQYGRRKVFFAAVLLPCFKTAGGRLEDEARQGPGGGEKKRGGLGPGDNCTASNEKLGWGLGTRLDVICSEQSDHLMQSVILINAYPITSYLLQRWIGRWRQRRLSRRLLTNQDENAPLLSKGLWYMQSDRYYGLI